MLSDDLARSIEWRRVVIWSSVGWISGVSIGRDGGRDGGRGGGGVLAFRRGSRWGPGGDSGWDSRGCCPRFNSISGLGAGDNSISGGGQAFGNGVTRGGEGCFGTMSSISEPSNLSLGT